MQIVYLLSDVDVVDDQFLAAVAEVVGTGDVQVKCFRNDDVENVDERAHSGTAVYVDWLRRPGRYGLDLVIYGTRVLTPNQSEGEFARDLARVLGRPLLLSDCIAFPFSYFRIDPDGAMSEVVCRQDDAEGEHCDLLCDLPIEDPDYCPALLVWAAGEGFPGKPPDAPDHMPPSLRVNCYSSHAGLCETFWATCPKRTRSAVQKHT